MVGSSTWGWRRGGCRGQPSGPPGDLRSQAVLTGRWTGPDFPEEGMPPTGPGSGPRSSGRETEAEPRPQEEATQRVTGKDKSHVPGTRALRRGPRPKDPFPSGGHPWLQGQLRSLRCCARSWTQRTPAGDRTHTQGTPRRDLQRQGWGLGALRGQAWGAQGQSGSEGSWDHARGPSPPPSRALRDH